MPSQINACMTCGTMTVERAGISGSKLETLGYVAELSYTFVTGKNLLLGIKAGFQNDTNGDVITYYGIIIGKKFRDNK